MKTLAESNKFIVVHEYEVVWLCHVDGRKTVIGDFYGDPRCALIDREEKWCVVAGEGIIVYLLREPFDEYSRGATCRQYQELLREPERSIWIEALTQTGSNSVSSKSEGGETYNISLDAGGCAAVQLQLQGLPQ